MTLQLLRASFSPKQYKQLRDQPLTRVVRLVLLVLLASVAIATLLVLPTVLQSDALVRALAKTTNVTIDATFTQTEPTFLLRNPDILMTTGAEDAFITVTPESVSRKRFLLFGAQSYSWEPLTSLDTFPAQEILVPLAVFLIPSIIVWLALLVCAYCVLGTLLYVLVAGITLHVQNYAVTTGTILKVTVFALIPSLAIFGVLPILRLGLPLSILFGSMCILWIALATAGLLTVIEKKPTKYTEKR